MLKMLLLLAIVAGALVAVALFIVDQRNRRRRRASRSRREGDYAERKTMWQSYLQNNRARRVRRITDQSSSGE